MRDLEWSMSEAAASMASSSLLAGGASRPLSSPPRAGDMATASEGAPECPPRGTEPRERERRVLGVAGAAREEG